MTIDMPKTPVSEGVRRSSGSYELVFSAALMGLVGFGLDTLLFGGWWWGCLKGLRFV